MMINQDFKSLSKSNNVLNSQSSITKGYTPQGISSNELRDLSCSPETPRSVFRLIVDSAKKLDPRQQLIPGSKRASTLTVITSMVGGGTLALPFAMANAGFVCTLIYFPLFASMCAWSLHGLILVGQKTNANTFYDIAKILYGAKVAVSVEMLLIVNLVLASVAYLTMVKNLFPLAMQIELHTSDKNPWTSSAFLVPMTAVLVISPLALMPRVGALRYASLCGFCLVIYLTCITVYTYFDYCDMSYGHGCFTSTNPDVAVIWDNVDWYGLSWTNHFYTIPTIISSFAAHPTVLPIYIELQRKSPQEMWIVVIVGLSVATLIYSVLASFGYFTFVNETKANFLLNDYHHDILVVFAAIGLCLVCALAIPLFLHAKRRSITTLYYNHFAKNKTSAKEQLLVGSKNREHRSFSMDSESDSELGKQAHPLVETPELAFVRPRPKFIRRQREAKHPQKRLPMWCNVIITFTLLFVEAFASLYISNIGVVLAFLGSTAFPACCYVFPTFALWKVHRQYPHDKEIDTKLLVIVTFSAVVVTGSGVLGLLKLFGILK